MQLKEEVAILVVIYGGLLLLNNKRISLMAFYCDLSLISEDTFGNLHQNSKESVMQAIDNMPEPRYEDLSVKGFYKYIDSLYVKGETKTPTKEIVKKINKKTKKAKVKKTETKKRRAHFAQVRAQRILQLLANGVEYVCVQEGCAVDEDLTVDHKTALSKGGSDDVSNLQFMCRSHNSSKGDRGHEGP